MHSLSDGFSESFCNFIKHLNKHLPHNELVESILWSDQPSDGYLGTGERVENSTIENTRTNIKI